MTTQTTSRPGVTRSVDLLPWADPYVLQLFAEAGLVERASEAEPAGDATPACVQFVDSADVVQAILTRDSWKITNLRRPSISRTRRTESALRLAPC